MKSYKNVDANELTHWGRVTHICVSKLTSVVSDNGLSPGRRQAIIWTNAGIVLIGPLGTNFSENLIEIHVLSFNKMYLKMSSRKWRPFCLGLNVLILMLGHLGLIIDIMISDYIITCITKSYFLPGHCVINTSGRAWQGWTHWPLGDLNEILVK